MLRLLNTQRKNPGNALESCGHALEPLKNIAMNPKYRAMNAMIQLTADADTRPMRVRSIAGQMITKIKNEQNNMMNPEYRAMNVVIQLTVGAG